jgi:hypothetical protein
MPDRSPITFTLDLEDHRPSSDVPVRFPDATRRILDWLDGLGVRGTVFVVRRGGRGGAGTRPRRRGTRPRARAPRLAAHAAHRAPTRASLRGDLARGKALLEDLGGAPVTGFRAPTFSLVPDSRLGDRRRRRGGVHLLVERAARPQPAVRRPVVLDEAVPVAQRAARAAVPRRPGRWRPACRTSAGCTSHAAVAGVRSLLADRRRRRAAVDLLPSVRLRPRRAGCGACPTSGRLGNRLALVQPQAAVSTSSRVCCATAPARRWATASGTITAESS